MPNASPDFKLTANANLHRATMQPFLDKTEK